MRKPITVRCCIILSTKATEAGLRPWSRDRTDGVMPEPAMTDAVPSPAPMSRPVSNSDMPGDNAPHILVIDDDRRIRELLRSYLADNGFRVSAAGSADEAREHMRGLEFDL